MLIFMESSSEIRTLESVRLYQWMPGRVNLNRSKTIYLLPIELCYGLCAREDVVKLHVEDSFKMEAKL